MTNYFGKQKLTQLLYNYLELSAPEKLAELKRELKAAGEGRKYIIGYKKYRGSEWLTSSICFGEIEYIFEIYACGSAGKRVVLREHRIMDDEHGNEIRSDIFSGHACYDEDFKPITETTDKYSDLLICNHLQKKDKPNGEREGGEDDE